MSDLHLTLACGPYDRTESLRSGEVKPAGIDLTYVTGRSSRETFSRMVKHQAFDVAEMSCAFYLGRKAQGGFPFTAIPVFPSRRFRHGFVFVHRDSDIHSPKDLEGKRVGVPEYRVTAAIWVRGILAEHFGVDLGRMQWHVGGLDRSASDPGIVATSLPFEMARPVGVQTVSADRTLGGMLAVGDLDALISPRVPKSYFTAETVERLFPDYPDREREYFRSTGIFPIMHTVVIRNDLYQRHPWIADSLYDAFVASRNRAWERLGSSGALTTMLPWQYADVEEMAGLHESLWTYGLEPNRHVLDKLVSYLVDQGFIDRRVPLDEVFAPVVEVGR